MAHKYFNIANILTLSRLVLTIPFVFLILYDNYIMALLVFILIALTELDGTVARRLKISSRFGELFDFYIDIISGTICFTTLIIREGLLVSSIFFWIIINLLLIILLIYSNNRSENLHKISKLNKVNGIFADIMLISLLLGWNNIFAFALYLSTFYIITLIAIITIYLL